MKKIHLEEGEVMCSKCNGSGYTQDNSDFNRYNICNKCYGEGKLDWIDNILGKIVSTTATFSVDTIDISTLSPQLKGNFHEEMIEVLTKQFVKEMDREILETIMEQYNLDLNKIGKEDKEFDN